MSEGWYLMVNNVRYSSLKSVGNSAFECYYYKYGEWFEHSRCGEFDRVTGAVRRFLKTEDYTLLQEIRIGE